MASTDARPIPKKNTAYRVTFPIFDADGDLVTGAASLDSEVSIDAAAFADCTNEATEIATSSGMYYLDLTAAEMNGDTIAIIVKTGTAGAKTTPIVLYPEEAGDIRVDVTQWLGTAAATPTVAGVPEVDVTHWIGTAAATPTVAGVPEVDVTHIGGGAQSATDLKDFADDGYDPATNKVQGVVLVDTLTTYTGNTVQTGDSFARLGAPAGASVSADIAGVQSDTDNIQTRLPAALTTGTSDSGTTTTMVDAARTEADTDYWKGCWIRFTSGTISGQVRLITGFTPATDTITFAPATTQAVSTQTYEILPAARIDIGLWLGSLPNDLISGRVDANTQAMANGVITAAVIATDAIDADAIAADAIGSSELAASAVTEIQSGLSTLTTAQVNAEVVDALATDTYVEPGQGAPAATATLAAKINYLYKAWRNKSTQTSTTYSLYADDTTTVDQKATVSDDATTFTKGEVATGP